MKGLTQASATLLIGILTCAASLTATYLSSHNADQLKEIAKFQYETQNRDALRSLVSEIQNTLASTRVDALSFALASRLRRPEELEVYNKAIIAHYTVLTGHIQSVKFRVSDKSISCTNEFERILSEQFPKLSGKNQLEVVNAALIAIETANTDWISCNEQLLKTEP